jgi:hypothetical protein
MPLGPQEIRRPLCRLLWHIIHPINHVPEWSTGDVLTGGAHNSLTIDAVAEPRQPVSIYGYQRCPSVLLRSLNVSDDCP